VLETQTKIIGQVGWKNHGVLRHPYLFLESRSVDRPVPNPSLGCIYRSWSRRIRHDRSETLANNASNLNIMLWGSFWISLLLNFSLFLPQVAQSQEIPDRLLGSLQKFWRTPDGNVSDLSQTFYKGQALPIVWGEWLDQTYMNGTASRYHLWVTGFDFNQQSYVQLLSRTFKSHHYLIVNVESTLTHSRRC
jgi:hypothetical protein